ncbi:MAG: aldo/keto reductase [Woeseiaceae bacterium]|jgi:diketogulonate reductase-like aldo/keto reductase
MMLNRRNFVQAMGAASLAGALPGGVHAAGPEPLPRRPIPGTDESIAIVGLGNARAFHESDMALSRQLIDVLLEHGGSYIDSGWDGRTVLSTISREFDAQEQLFLGTYIEGKDLRSMRAEVQGFVDLQGGGPLDMVQIYSPEELEQRYDEFVALREEGLVRYFGVARYAKEFYPAMMNVMEKGLVDFVQFNYSIMEPEAADDILPLAQETGTAVIANRPFINGNYFDVVRGQALPGWAADFDCHSWAQFSLKYILAHPAVTCVITETSNPKHVIDNLGAGYGRLPDADQTRQMEAVIRGLL